MTKVAKERGAAGRPTVYVDDRRLKRSDSEVGKVGWWAPRGVVMGAWVVAGWPVWRWFVARLGDGSDEPWGLVALVAALVFVPWRRWREPLPVRAAVMAAGVALAVILGYDVLPPIVRGGLWMLALVALLGGTGPAVARASLLLLSLPVVATTQFYLGYPLRAFTAACSVPLLHGLGYAVTRQGTALRWAGETVLVDAPCSGIQMLWTGLFAACVLAAVRGLGGWATLRLLRWAAAIVAAANLLRCAALFLVEVEGGPPPRWLHEGIGLVLFGAALGTVAWTAGRLAVPGAKASSCLRPPCAIGGGHCWSVAVLAVVMVGAAGRPLWGTVAEVAEIVAPFPGWPETFEGRALVPLVATEREARFAAGFPGKVAAFSDGERTVVLRWVARETRKLHPVLHCLRGLGYAVQPGPVWRDAAGRCWGTTEAKRGGRTIRVRERIADGVGGEWTDVSAWWWDAWRRRSAGPWWAVTVLE